MKKTIGYISYTHGLDGKVKIVPMVENIKFVEFIKNHKILCKEKEIKINIFAFNGKIFIVKIEGINNIDEAKNIIKNEIYTDIEDDCDINPENILMFDVYVENDNEKYGSIIDYGDYGNGMVIEIKVAKTLKSEFFKCDKENILQIDFNLKRIVIKKREEI